MLAQAHQHPLSKQSGQAFLQIPPRNNTVPIPPRHAGQSKFEFTPRNKNRAIPTTLPPQNVPQYPTNYSKIYNGGSVVMTKNQRHGADKPHVTIDPRFAPSIEVLPSRSSPSRTGKDSSTLKVPQRRAMTSALYHPSTTSPNFATSGLDFAFLRNSHTLPK